MSEIIVITSGKGGVGKTTLTANLGLALAAKGKKVLLLDTDIGQRNLDIVLGYENRIVYDIVDVCEGLCDVDKAIIEDKENENIFLIPAAQAKDKFSITPMQMKSLVDSVKGNFDYVLIDCPAGIEQGFENAIAAADDAIIVTVPDAASVRDADRVVGILEQHGIENIKLVINKIRPSLVKKGHMLSIEEVLEILSVELLGAVPDDDDVIIALNTKKPVACNMKSETGQAYRNIASRLLGEKVQLVNLKEKGFFSKIADLFKK